MNGDKIHLLTHLQCQYCDESISCESDRIVFCNEACLDAYISDARSMEEFLIKQKEQEDEI